MLCHSCGKKTVKNATYCSSCGTLLSEEKQYNENSIVVNKEQISDQSTHDLGTNDGGNTSPMNRFTRKNSPKRLASILLWLIPLISLLFVVSGTYAYYSYEKDVNATVLQLRELAKLEMLNENYEEATNLIKQAQQLRPDYRVLMDELVVIKLGKAYKDEISSIDHFIRQKDYAKATAEANRLIDDIQMQNNPIFDSFIEKLKETERTILIAKTNSKVNKLHTVEELATELILISTIENEQASLLETEIRDKIVEISLQDAKKKLNDKDFHQAITLINKGLQYVPNHEKLLSYKSTIRNAQQTFENEEQKQMEAAMEAAAREDLRNRTNAVEVTSFHPYIDESGNLIVTGWLQNIATTQISAVTVYFSIYDLEGEFLKSDSTTVSPYYLQPTEMGQFHKIIYNINEDVNIIFDSFTWNLS